MRWFVALLALVLVGCALELPDAPQIHCRPEPGTPNCNGDARRDECAALGLPDACIQRRQGVYRCLAAGDLLCCYP